VDKTRAILSRPTQSKRAETSKTHKQCHGPQLAVIREQMSMTGQRRYQANVGRIEHPEGSSRTTVLSVLKYRLPLWVISSGHLGVMQFLSREWNPSGGIPWKEWKRWKARHGQGWQRKRKHLFLCRFQGLMRGQETFQDRGAYGGWELRVSKYQACENADGSANPSTRAADFRTTAGLMDWW